MAGLQWVQPGVVEPPVHDVHGLQPVDRTQPHAALPHHDVGTLDQVHAEARRQVALLHVRVAGRAGRQQHGAWAATVARRRGGQRPAQFVSGLVDRRGTCGAQAVGQQPGEDAAVQERIAQPGGRVGGVGDHVPRAVPVAGHVERVRRQPAVHRTRPAGSRPVRGQPVQHPTRQQAGGDQRAGAVAVGQHGLQHTHPLDGSGSEPVELSALDEVRDRIQPPRMALRPRRHSLRVVPPDRHREIVDEVASSLGVEEAVGLALTFQQRRRVQRAQRSGDAAPHLPGRAVHAGDLVEVPGRGCVAEGVERHRSTLPRRRTSRGPCRSRGRVQSAAGPSPRPARRRRPL